MDQEKKLTGRDCWVTINREESLLGCDDVSMCAAQANGLTAVVIKPEGSVQRCRSGRKLTDKR